MDHAIEYHTISLAIMCLELYAIVPGGKAEKNECHISQFKQSSNNLLKYTVVLHITKTQYKVA